MTVETQPFTQVRLSLADIAGDAYVDAVCAARAALTGEDDADLGAAARRRIDFYPTTMQTRLTALLPQVGARIAAPLRASAKGATSQHFQQVTNTDAAPLSGFGYYRVGEDGRLYLVTKSEHYHAPLGHAFPGYQLVEQAKALGIPNATHNNTRGHLTRLLEEELVAAAHGIAPGERAALDAIRAAARPDCVNRVLNLETGSLACEAALKMMLARFYRPQEGFPTPPYQGRTPVLLVIGNDTDGLQANYHGTNLLPQTMRGMWPELREALEEQDIFRVCAVRPNNIADLEAAFRTYEQGRYKIAGFFHEIVMMNYGARLLSREFLHRAYALCRQHDVPTAVDEIQSCMWAPHFFLFREYGLEPTFVVVGKGFPGGEYPASRIIFSATMDNLPQFGALVTNGQEELASLAYLITMRWAGANADAIRRHGDYYEERLRELAARHADHVAGADGNRHMTSLCFHQLDRAKAFVARLNARGLDISVQTYKDDCPPAVLSKLPVTADAAVVDFVAALMESALADLT